MTHRIGTFLMLVGALMVGLYAVSDVVESPTCGLLVGGGMLFAFGIFLWFRDPGPPPKPSGRFRVLKSIGKKQEKKK